MTRLAGARTCHEAGEAPLGRCGCGGRQRCGGGGQAGISSRWARRRWGWGVAKKHAARRTTVTTGKAGCSLEARIPVFDSAMSAEGEDRGRCDGSAYVLDQERQVGDVQGLVDR